MEAQEQGLQQGKSCMSSELPVDLLSLDMYSMLTLEEKDNQEGEADTDNKDQEPGRSRPKRKAPGEQLAKVNRRHVETSGKWPRWQQWNPNKGPYNRVENNPLGMHMEDSSQELEDNQGLILPQNILPQDTMNTSGAASSSGGTPEVVQITEAGAGDDVYWDADFVWVKWGGAWWKQHPDGWWEKWENPAESEG